MTGLLPRRVLPVLMYHRVGPPGEGDPALSLSPEVFASQLDRIAARGLRTLSLDQAFDAFASGRSPRRSVLLTLDDGFEETLRQVLPLLTSREMRAAVFVPAGLVGREAALVPSYGGSAEQPERGRIAGSSLLREWIDAGLGVGSHSLTHGDLTRMDRAEAAREAAESKQRLEEILHRPVLDFCYPYAHHDPPTRRAVRAAGYRAAYAGEPPLDDLYALPRMMVYPGDGERRFARKLSGYYYWLTAWHRRILRSNS